MNRLVELSRFNAKSDKGNLYTIIVYQEYYPVGTLPTPKAEMKGRLRWITSDGLDCTQIDAKTFKIDSIGETVRKI